MGLSPHPRVIPSVFNRSGFGPPRGLTPLHPCPWIAHPASRPRHATQIALFRLAFAAARCPLTSPHAATRRLILQKARGHRRQNGSRCLGATVSGAVSLPPRGAFHLSLAVLVRYRSSESVQPWRVVPCFGPGFTCPALLWIVDRSPVLRVRGFSPAAAGLPMPFRSNRGFVPRAGAWGPRASASATPARQRPQPWRRRRFGLALSLAATRAISFDFSSSGYLDVSVPGCPPKDGLQSGSRP